MPKLRNKRQSHRPYHAVTTSSYQPVRYEEEARKLPIDIEPAKKKRLTWKKKLLLAFIVLLVPFLVIGVWDLRNFSAASQKLFGTSSTVGVLAPTNLETTAQGRVNILLVGYSIDDPGHGGAELTDSILILSMDTADHTGYMLSVPRDLYVNIPNYGQAKINEAYQAGEYLKFRSPGYPQGGMGLLEKVIKDSFGTPIHYYALINYTAVREIVDALGGVTVAIKSEDPRGIYDPNFPVNQGGPLRLTNGNHKVNGQTALRLTRARGSTYGSFGFPLSDFNRTQNQQQIFLAIQKKLTWTLVLDPRKNGKIFEAAGDNIKTDVRQSEVIPMYRLFTSISADKIKPVNLRDVGGINLLTGFTTPAGQSALIPAAGLNEYSQIQAAIKKLNN